MKVCSRYHEEIVYDSFSCPMCELIEKHEEEIEKLIDNK